MKSQMISAPVATVAAHTITAIAHSTGSRLFVLRASLYAAIAMIAMTAGPTRKKTVSTCESPGNAGVQRCEGRDEQKGRDDERERDDEGAERTAREVTEPHRELRRERSRHRR